MSPTSLLLLLSAAALHAAANALIKQARDKVAFTWWMLGLSSLPGLLVWLPSARVDSAGWPFVIASGLLEAAYFFSLTRAYSHGDLSHVYPIARGSAPLFVALWAALFLGERPSPAGLLGIGLIVSGLYLVNLTSLADWRRPLLGLRHPAARWALLTGLLISAYSTVDKAGVQYFDPLGYLFLILFVGWLAMAAQWLAPSRRTALVAELRPDGANERGRLGRLARIAACALFGNAAYWLVLTAMRISPVSYVSPVREVSVVVGAWIGVRFMGERGGAVRVIASALVAAGILTIALGG